MRRYVAILSLSALALTMGCGEKSTTQAPVPPPRVVVWEAQGGSVGDLLLASQAESPPGTRPVHIALRFRGGEAPERVVGTTEDLPFVVQGLPVGSYELRLMRAETGALLWRPEGFGAQRATRTIDVQAEQQTRVDLDLAFPSASMRIALHLPSGRGVGDVRWSVHQRRGDDGWTSLPVQPHAQRRGNSGDTLLVTELPLGTYRVAGDLPDRQRVFSAPVSLTTIGQIADVALDLGSGPVLSPIRIEFVGDFPNNPDYGDSIPIQLISMSRGREGLHHAQGLLRDSARSIEATGVPPGLTLVLLHGLGLACFERCAPDRLLRIDITDAPRPVRDGVPLPVQIRREGEPLGRVLLGLRPATEGAAEMPPPGVWFRYTRHVARGHFENVAEGTYHVFAIDNACGGWHGIPQPLIWDVQVTARTEDVILDVGASR